MNENTQKKLGDSGHKVPILGNKCYRCGHEWRPYDVDVKPRVCPKCKNAYWDRPKKIAEQPA